ncbi:MAG: hypothetical protein GXP42_14320 [Chloroflexi bacterium]|nr:hypothetical protein [Chloroflexota bacterium]
MSRLKHFIFMLASSSLLALAFLLLMQQSARGLTSGGATHYVAPGGNCGAASPCYATVQAAVDAANPDDLIKIAQGTYIDIHTRNNVTQVVYINKRITIQGGYTLADWQTPDPAAHPTILDAQGKGRVFYVAGQPGVTIQGLTVKNGDATDLGGSPWGDDAGGGLFIDSSQVHLRDLIIMGGKAYRGGGAFLSAWGHVIQNCEIVSNTADMGGGVYVLGNANQLINNVIRSNHADWGGGGLFLTGNLIALVNNAVIDNRAQTYEGAAMFLYGSRVDMVHTTLARNAGQSGVFLDNAGFSTSSTTAFMTNTIVAGHTVGVKLSIRQHNTATLTATLWHDNVTDRDAGSGVIHHSQDAAGDPAFAVDGYHLTSSSAAIDKGVNAGVWMDIDDQLRPYGQGYDLGADEFGAGSIRRIYLPLAWRKR